MHMILRTLLIFLKKPFLEKSAFHDKTTITLRVLPTDLDLLWHVNNGVYFSFMDLGRWDATFRNGAFDKAKKQGWYPVVAGETIKFKKSLQLWDKFQIETAIKGYDEKYIFVQQRFLKNGEVMAIGLVKARFLKRSGGTVPVKDLLDVMGDHSLDNAPELSNDWFGLENKHLV